MSYLELRAQELKRQIENIKEDEDQIRMQMLEIERDFIRESSARLINRIVRGY